MNSSKMPTGLYMMFSYFAGVFAAVDKTHWLMWLLPLLPLVMLIPLKWLWEYEPKQRSIEDWTTKT